MEENKDLGPSLIDSIGKPVLDEVGLDLSEVVLDSILNDGILKDIPFVRTFVGIGKFVFRIYDRIFLKKVVKFLIELSNISTEEKEEFLGKLKDEKKERELGESLILYLDRHENFKKPELLAKVFKAYIQHHLTYEQFHLLAASIDKALVQDIEILVDLVHKGIENRKREDVYHLYHLDKEKQIVAKSLYGAGLSNIDLEIERGKSLGQAMAERGMGSYSHEPGPIKKIGVSFVLKPEAELLARAILDSWE